MIYRWCQHLLTLSLLLLVSCNFKPVYQRPCMDIPDEWRFKADPGPNDCVNVRWWEQLGDPILDQLIQMALLNNQDLKVATCRVIDFYAKFRIVASQLFPQIYGNADYLREELTNALNYSPIRPGTRYNSVYTLSVSLSYEIDFWARIQNESEAFFSLFLGQIEARRTVILSLISAVANGYILLRQFDNQLKISEMTYEDRVKAWKIIKLRFEVGLVSEMEVKQAESEVELAQVQVEQFKQLIPQQEDLISVLLGIPPTPICRGKLLDDMKEPPYIPAGLPSDLLQDRPDILQAEFALLAANAEIGAAKAAFFPTISLTSLFGFQSTALRNLLTSSARMWDWGISVTQPIFTGWLLTFQLEEAKAQWCEAIHVYQQTILTAFKEVSDALIGHEQAKKIYKVQKEAVDALAVYLKLANLRYDNGQNDYLTVLDAERRLFQAQLDLAQAQGNIFITLVDIYKALGGGWVIEADENLTCK